MITLTVVGPSYFSHGVWESEFCQAAEILIIGGLAVHFQLYCSTLTDKYPNFKKVL